MRKSILIGTWIDESGDENRAKVEIELRRRNEPSETINHEIVENHIELSIMGVTTTRFSGGRKWYESSAGQCLNEVAKVTSYAKGWDSVKQNRLIEVWDQWHLNGMRAACAHQTVEYENGRYGRQPSLTLTKPCPVTGYKYGHAWLVAELSEDVIEFITSLGVELPA